MNNERKDTTAWIFQTWISFVISLTVTAVGIAYLPVTPWIQAFLGMGLLFTVGSSFTLAKTIRDNHEAEKLSTRLKDAKAEKIIREFSEVA